MPAARKKRPDTVSRRILITWGLVIGAPLFAWCLFYVSMSGGPTAVLLNSLPAPNAQSSEVKEARDNTKLTINKDFTALEQIIGLQPVDSSYQDSCDKGTNNAKIQNGYAYRCVYRSTRFYGTEQSNSDINRIIKSTDWAPESLEDDLNLISWKRYHKDSYTLEIGHYETTHDTSSEINFAQGQWYKPPSTKYNEYAFKDAPSVFKKIAEKNKWLVIIYIERPYFQIDLSRMFAF